MLILGNDMWHFQSALKAMVAGQVNPVKESFGN